MKGGPPGWGGALLGQAAPPLPTPGCSPSVCFLCSGPHALFPSFLLPLETAPFQTPALLALSLKIDFSEVFPLSWARSPAGPNAPAGGGGTGREHPPQAVVLCACWAALLGSPSPLPTPRGSGPAGLPSFPAPPCLPHTVQLWGWRKGGLCPFAHLAQQAETQPINIF